MIRDSPIEQAKKAVKLADYAQAKLTKSKGGKYVCPHCGSGDGSHAGSDSAFSIDGELWKCFGCNHGGDVFTLAAFVEGLDEKDKAGQLKAVEEFAHIDRGKSSSPTSKKAATPKAKDTGKQKPTEAQLEAGRKHERELIEEARKHLTHPQALKYLEERGYSLAEAEALGWGYNDNSKRLVIPYPGSDYYHIDRDTTGNANNKYSKPKSDNVGPEPLYNKDALKTEKVVFVVEGALDAASVRICGAPAVALCGVGRTGILRELEAIPAANRPVALLMLDRDSRGESGAQEIAQDMAKAGIPHRIVSDYPQELDGCKDADEMRKANKEALKTWLNSICKQAIRDTGELRDQSYQAELAALQIKNPLDIAMRLWNGEEVIEDVPTGLRNLDNALGGGLPGAGLIIIGAISSMGKTTLTAQIADNIAEAGRPALFVTIEQTSREIVAKSLARMTHRNGHGISARAITRPSLRKIWKEEEWHAYQQACQDYTNRIAPRMHILEGRDRKEGGEYIRANVETIRKAALKIAEHIGTAPAVFVDYLQILAPVSGALNDKAATDDNITKLRQLANELQTPVMAISSFNRDAYDHETRLDSFKESGSIEYGADLLLGLQPYELRELTHVSKDVRARDTREVYERVKHQDVRDVEVAVLKRRDCFLAKQPVVLTYRAEFDVFEDSTRY